MKAVCIIGSPRRQGSTATLVGRFVEGLRVSGTEVTELHLGELSINYCRGCRKCEETGQCVHPDDMDLLIQAVLAADVVLLASPSYWGDVTGQMKVFIDRCLRLCNARTGETPVPRGKLGIGMAIRAGQQRSESDHLIDTFRHYFGHLGIKMVGHLTAEGVDTPDDLTPEKLEEAYRLGRQLVR